MFSTIIISKSTQHWVKPLFKSGLIDNCLWFALYLVLFSGSLFCTALVAQSQSNTLFFVSPGITLSGEEHISVWKETSESKAPRVVYMVENTIFYSHQCLDATIVHIDKSPILNHQKQIAKSEMVLAKSERVPEIKSDDKPKTVRTSGDKYISLTSFSDSFPARDSHSVFLAVASSTSYSNCSRKGKPNRYCKVVSHICSLDFLKQAKQFFPDFENLAILNPIPIKPCCRPPSFRG